MVKGTRRSKTVLKVFGDIWVRWLRCTSIDGAPLAVTLDILMNTFTFFRADKRDFSVGDVLESAGEFLAKNPLGSMDNEKIFEKMRPNNLPPRAECLYVFEHLNDAKKHWSKMRGGKLYKVTVKISDILHKGDMSLVDLAFVNQSMPEVVATYVRQYWLGECTSKPVIEVLVRNALIAEVISKNDQERQAYFKSWAISGMPNK